MQDLRVTLVQSSLHWEDRAANLASFEKKLEGAAGHTDLVVLPEMFTTGFTMNAANLAEPMSGPTMAWMARQAAKLGATVTGSFIATENGRYYNRLIWMRPDGSYASYDKHHLFTLAGEHHTYTAGDKQLVVGLHGWKILPLICYDLRFPAWSRNVAGYGLLIYVANWPEPRRHHWRSLLAARAIENQSYTLGINCVGKDGNGFDYTGDTSVFNYTGEELLHAANTEGCFTLTLSHAEQVAFREKLPFLADRDNFSWQ
ncbi:MAG: amidohydrolase [Phaeodactylibacter sp.]|nr:amidohydrolase [Phaeodactylibacter sp.]MCB9272534.1 amidohydrolase [Lewinellaceae bacterium]